MNKKILLPTDFSKNSWNAILYATELYKNEQVDFFLLNAFQASTVPPSLDLFRAPEPGEKLYEDAKEKSYLGLEKSLLRIKAHKENEKHNYYTASCYNPTLEAVQKFIEDVDIEMVIISNKGDTNNLGSTIGQNAIAMMEEIRNCPVLMIPNNVSFKEPNEIVFPTSFKTHYKQRELRYLYEIAKITNAPVRVLHIGKEDNLLQQQKDKKILLEKCLDGLEFSFHYLEDSNINKALQLFVQSRSSEMITFINRKHTLFYSIFNNPMVKDLGYNATVPVLAMHDLRN